MSFDLTAQRPTAKAFLEQRSHKRLRAIGLVRFFLASAFFVGSVLIQTRLKALTPAFEMFVYASMGYFFYASLVIALDVFKVLTISAPYVVFVLALDFVFFAVLIFLTGGMQSQIKYLFWILIFYTGVLFDFRGAVLASLVTGLLFAWMGNLSFLLQDSHVLTWLLDLKGMQAKASTTEVLLNSSGFVLFGLVSAMVGQRIRANDDQMYHNQRALRQLEAQVESFEKMAEMGQMAAKMAHEIRNPLTSVSASIEMLGTENNPVQKQELSEIARNQIQKLNLLIENFLNFAKPDQLALQPQYVSKLLEETLNLFALGHPKITLVKNIDMPDEKPVMLDQLKINQLFWNVLTNAAQAMEGAGEIKVMLASKEDCIEVSFTDQGPGIPSELLGQVFEPFKTTKKNGTGLGLAIVSVIARDHGALVKLHNRDRGSGACFILSLPVA